jgi:hypothetical protein
MKGASGVYCSSLHKSEADAEDAARQIRQCDQGSPVGSSRSAVHNSHSATAIAVRLVEWLQQFFIALDVALDFFSKINRRIAKAE